MRKLMDKCCFCYDIELSQVVQVAYAYNTQFTLLLEIVETLKAISIFKEISTLIVDYKNCS